MDEKIDFTKFVERKPEKVTWMEFQESSGFEICFRYISRVQLNAIFTRHTKNPFRKSIGAREARLDTKGWNREFASNTIDGWRGLTVGVLKSIAAVNVQMAKEVSDDTEIPYSVDMAEILLEEVYDFDRFCLEAATDISNYRTFGEISEDAAKNLSSTHDGT